MGQPRAYRIYEGSIDDRLSRLAQSYIQSRGHLAVARQRYVSALVNQRTVYGADYYDRWSRNWWDRAVARDRERYHQALRRVLALGAEMEQLRERQRNYWDQIEPRPTGSGRRTGNPQEKRNPLGVEMSDVTVEVEAEFQRDRLREVAAPIITEQVNRLRASSEEIVLDEESKPVRELLAENAKQLARDIEALEKTPSFPNVVHVLVDLEIPSTFSTSHRDEQLRDGIAAVRTALRRVEVRVDRAIDGDPRKENLELKLKVRGARAMHENLPTPEQRLRTVRREPRRTWRVRAGDSLPAIAREVYGDSSLWDILFLANVGSLGLQDPSRLPIDTALRIPWFRRPADDS